MTNTMKQRLAKFLATSGVSSRRAGETLIEQGKVKVNGAIIFSPVTFVDSDDTIEVNGEIISNSEPTPRLWCYYKPVGLITTHDDPYKRPTVFEDLRDLPRVISAGRLDINSEGLLILTTSSKISRFLELPANKIIRRYKVRTYGDHGWLLDFVHANKHKSEYELTVDGIDYVIRQMKILDIADRRGWFEITLTEGKNRELRNIFSYFDLRVSRLIRIAYGPFSLGELNPSEYIEQPLHSFQKFLL